MDQLASLSRERVAVEAASWSSKVVRTGGISGPLHEEWAFSLRVTCGVPVRGVAFADIGGVRWHARDWARRAANVVQLGVAFSPFDWAHSDIVGVNAADGGIRFSVKSSDLKSDPVAGTTVDVELGASGWTGVPMTVLTVPSVGLAVGVLLVCSADTRADRTRWRVRDEHIPGLAGFAFIATGRRSGQHQLS